MKSKSNSTMIRPWTITAKAGGEIEILLYEMIGQDFWTGEGTTAKAFAEDLKAAGSVSKIHLRVNSPGGNVFDGIAIYNTLLSHGATVTAQVDGIAASIASVIIMAASEISMGDNAMMMIHNPATTVGGDSNRMRKMADTMDKVKSSMITAYRRHTKKSVEEVGALMDAETWMTAQEAKDNEFAEIVTTPEGDDADVAANFDLSMYRKVPVQIAARMGKRTRPPVAQAECACACSACMKGDCEDCTMAGCSDAGCKSEDCAMQNAAKLSAARAARSSATSEQVQVQEIVALTENIVGLRAQVATAEDRTIKAEDRAGKAEERAGQAEMALATAREEHAAGEAGHGKWMARVGGELDKAEKLLVALGEELARRESPAAISAGEGRSKLLQSTLTEIGAALGKEKTARASEMAALRRIGMDVEKANGTFAEVHAELARRQHPATADAGIDRLKSLEEKLTTITASLTQEKTVYATDAAALQHLGDEVEKATENFAGVRAELARRQHPALLDTGMLRLQSFEEKLAGIAGNLREENAAHTANADWLKVVGALIAKATAAFATLQTKVGDLGAEGDDAGLKSVEEKLGELVESATQAKAAHVADAEWLKNIAPLFETATATFASVQAEVAERQTENAASTPLEMEKTTLADVVAFVARGKAAQTAGAEWLKRTIASLEKAAASFVAIQTEVGSHQTQAETVGLERLKTFETKLNELTASVTEEKTAQAANGKHLKSTGSLIEEANATFTAVLAEVGKHHSEATGTGIGRLKSLEGKLAELTTIVAEEKTARAAETVWPKRVSGEVEQTATVFKSVRAELGRLHHSRREEGLQSLADELAAITAAVGQEKATRAVEIAWPPRMSAEVEQATVVFKEVRAELAHRQYPSEAAIDRIESLEHKLASIAAAVAQETTDRASDVEALAAMNARLKEASAALGSANAEIGRRARIAAI